MGIPLIKAKAKSKAFLSEFRLRSLVFALIACSVIWFVFANLTSSTLGPFSIEGEVSFNNLKYELKGDDINIKKQNPSISWQGIIVTVLPLLTILFEFLQSAIDANKYGPHLALILKKKLHEVPEDSPEYKNLQVTLGSLEQELKGGIVKDKTIEKFLSDCQKEIK